jgi:hypothetical protein
MAIGIGHVCVDCRTWMMPLKNDIVVLETYEDGGDYKLWSADLGMCPKCKRRMIYGFGASHISEQYLPDFQEIKQRYLDAGILFTVDGCPEGMTRWDGRTN